MFIDHVFKNIFDVDHVEDEARYKCQEDDDGTEEDDDPAPLGCHGRADNVHLENQGGFDCAEHEEGNYNSQNGSMGV